MPEDSPDSNLTIAQAVEQLGVSERTLRRTLSLAQFTGRTQAIERQTKKGRRSTTTLPPDLIADLSSYFAEQGLLDSPADTVAETSASPGALGGDTTAASESVPVNEMLYAQVIAEKDARISDLQAALSRERENLEVERDAHKRAETLHLGSIGELQALRERLRDVESQNSKLIEALPVQEEKVEDGVVESLSESVKPQGFWDRLFKRR